MARFKERNLRLDDNETIVFGDADNNEMGYKPSAGKVMIEENIGLSAYPPLADEDLVPKKYLDEQPWRLGDDTFEPTGFVDFWLHSEMSFDNSLRTFTITPTGYPGGDYSIYLQGRKFTFTESLSAQISDVDGLHFVYFERLGTDSQTPSANLVTSQTPWDICEHALTAIVHWDSTNQEAILFGEERHGITMDCATHEYLHTTVNTRYRSGLTLTVAATGNPSGFDGSVDDQAQYAISDGKLADEDIIIDIVDSAAPANNWEQKLDPLAWLPIYYRGGGSGSWRISDADTFPLLWSGSEATSASGYTRPAWNNQSGFTLDEVTNLYYFSTWVMGTNDLSEPVAVICGQREDSNLEDALNNNTFASIAFGTFPFTEFKMLYRVTWQANSAYGNTPKAVIRDVTDFRAVTSLPTGQPSVFEHGSLGGRDDANQHPADAISTDETSWTGNLSGGGKDDVQAALDAFDSYIPPAGGLQIAPPTTDLTVSGITTTVPVTGNDTGFGAALYLDSDSWFREADASDISTMPCHVLAAESGNGAAIEVLLFGYTRNDAWSWTPGAEIYVDTTAGELTETQPAVSGDIVQVVGWAFSATILFFDRDKTTIEVL